MARYEPWREEAACRDEDTNIFFPLNDEGAAPALAVCAQCPVRAQCLEWALTTRQDDGIWGGMTENERRALRRKRRAAVRAA